MAASDTPPFDDSPTTPAATADSAIAFLRDPDSLVPTDDIVLSSLPELHFILSPSTTILRVSTNCLALLGCEPNLLLGQRLAALVHEDDARVFSTEINEALHPHAALPFRFYCRIRSVVHVGRDYSAFEFVGHYQVKTPYSLSPLQLMMPPPGIISITARPAITQRGYLMDGMLELKVEQIKLARRIAEMRHAEQDELDAEQRATPLLSFRHMDDHVWWRGSRDTTAGSVSRSRSSPPRLKVEPSPTNSEAIASESPSSPKVQLGDAGIPFFIRAEGAAERKMSNAQRLLKRKFVPRDFCCVSCGAVESPEWRAGPQGPKTLCNACGLKYAKQQRKADKIRDTSPV